MAKPNNNDLKKISSYRRSLIDKGEKGLLELSESLERRLYTFVINKFIPNLDIKNGKVVNNTSNLKQVNKAEGLRKFVKEVVNTQMERYYLEQFEILTKQTGKYFQDFEPSEALERRVKERGQLLIDGFLESLFGNNIILNDVQTTIRNGVVSSIKIDSLADLLQTQIEGKEKKFGLIKHYHYGNGFDEMQKYSRSLDNDYSAQLSLNYAIYQGGEINTTREFCDKRNGKVFNRETIESWNNLEWSGKILNGDVLIDCGGYNCRHDFDWISYELAKRLDPNIQKSTYDS